MPPMTAAMKPKMVYMRPVSNWNEVMGPITTPAAPPIEAASTKLSSCMRATPMPMRLAANGFSAQARKARPTRVAESVMPRATVNTAISPTSHRPCGGSSTPPKMIGRSPENAGKRVGLTAPHDEGAALEEREQPGAEDEHRADR